MDMAVTELSSVAVGTTKSMGMPAELCVRVEVVVFVAVIYLMTTCRAFVENRVISIGAPRVMRLFADVLLMACEVVVSNGEWNSFMVLVLTPSVVTFIRCADGDCSIVGLEFILGGLQLRCLRYGAISMVPAVTP